MDAIVHAADIQDRDGGVLLMATLFGLYPFLLKLYADAGYQSRSKIMFFVGRAFVASAELTPSAEMPFRFG